MPPRFAYWTIILDGGPTSFRAKEREELVPTLRQLQRTHPDAVLRWFARGRLWASPEDARGESRRPPHKPAADSRTRTWRPGGSHRDPRERFKVPRKVKRARFNAAQRRRKSSE